jgi:hypothetical protein
MQRLWRSTGAARGRRIRTGPLLDVAVAATAVGVAAGVGVSATPRCLCMDLPRVALDVLRHRDVRGRPLVAGVRNRRPRASRTSKKGTWRPSGRRWGEGGVAALVAFHARRDCHAAAPARRGSVRLAPDGSRTARGARARRLTLRPADRMRDRAQACRRSSRPAASRAGVSGWRRRQWRDTQRPAGLSSCV